MALKVVDRHDGNPQRIAERACHRCTDQQGARQARSGRVRNSVQVGEAEAGALRERRPVGFGSYEARSLSIRRSDGVAFDAEKGSGSQWEATAPYRGPADPNALDALLAKVLGTGQNPQPADATTTKEGEKSTDPITQTSVWARR